MAISWYTVYVAFLVIVNQGSILRVFALKCHVCSSDKMELCATLHFHSTNKVLPHELCAPDVTSCFTRIKDGNTVRGCTPTNAAWLKKISENDEYELCSSDQCNGKVFPENRLHCLHCSGLSCVNQSNTIDVRHPCVNYVATDECYTIFQYDGNNAYRGCASDSKNSLGKQYCTQYEDHCAKCTKRGCNSEPVHFEKPKLSCVKCEPSEEDKCQSVADGVEAIKCSVTVLGYVDNCYMYVDGNEHVHRGCYYEAPEHIRTECGNQYSESCEVCDSSDCNRDPFYPGKLRLQPRKSRIRRMITPRKCLRCNSDYDIQCELNAQLSESIECVGDECATYISVNGTVIRDCSQIFEDIVSEIATATTSITTTKPIANGTLITCDTDNCNGITSDKRYCFQCDSRIDPNCAAFINNAMITLCPYSVEDFGCYHQQTDNLTMRGCQINLKETERRQCLSNNAETCMICSANGCNSHSSLSKLSFEGNGEILEARVLCNDDTTQAPELRTEEIANGENESENRDNTNQNTPQKLSCYHCNSSDNNDCVSDLSGDLTTLCSTDGCYHEIKGNQIVRGCISDLNDDRKQKCLGNGDSCKSCIADNCNSKKTFLECFVGQSGGDAISKMPVSTKICTQYDDTCYIHVVNDKVHRGCFIEYAEENQLHEAFLDENNNSNLFAACAESKCNGVIPKQSVCVKCDSETDPNCANPKSDMMSQCELSIDFSACYHFDDGTKIVRGCMSEVQLDRKEDCVSNSTTCKVCIGNGCNKRQNFQRCLTCENGDECESTICSEYEDECYIHVQGRDQIRRGCLASAPANIKNKCHTSSVSCEKCSHQNDCNDRQIEEEYCLECDSVSLDECFYKPNETTMRAKCPLSIKPLGCYLLAKEVNTAERGCMSSLKESDRNHCKASSSKCKSCMGDVCNKKQRFQACVACNAKTYGCEDGAKSLPQIICPQYDSSCYSVVDKRGDVHRGCVGDSIIPDISACDGRDCQLCNDKNRCNQEKGFRSVCYECDSKSDPRCTDKPEKHKSCNLTLNKNGCFHKIEEKDGKSRVRRGCVNSLPAAEWNTCEAGTGTCRTCKRNNCNDQKAFATCINCSSTQDPNCVWLPNLSNRTKCKSYDDKCFTFLDSQTVRRGCLNEQGTKFSRECVGNPAKCLQCDPNKSDGYICNAKEIRLDTCFACDSQKDSRCRDKPHQLNQENCNKINGGAWKGCYLSIVDDHYKRGCVSNLRDSMLKECETNSDKCKTCMSKNCNLKPHFQDCVMCNSRDDQQCVSNAQLSRTDTCQSYLSTCIVGIDDYGVTHRRCAGQYSADSIQFTKGMFVCLHNNCNDVMFPANRLKCHQCSGGVECDSPAASDVLKPCAVVSPHDKCYTYLSKDNKMYRGCLSDSTDSRLLCGEHPESCVKCPKNGCNDQPKHYKPELKCHQCEGSDECAFGQSDGLETTCKKDVSFLEHETCFTLAPSETKVMRRGCTMDAYPSGEHCKESDGCNKCTTPGCNKDNVKYHQCVVCSSVNTTDCAKLSDPSSLMVQCDGEPYSHDKRGCYIMQKDNHVERGCLKDLQDDLEQCNESNKCQICREDGCNNRSISSATAISVNVICILLGLLVCYTYNMSA